MGITDYYDIPYPELTDEPDGAAQMKAIADRVEVLLKNGFQMPGGNLVVGGNTETNARGVNIVRLTAGLAIMSSLVTSGNACSLSVYENDVKKWTWWFDKTGAFNTSDAGGVYRPYPFATWAFNVNVTVTASTSGTSAATNAPTGRFTQVPIVTCTTSNPAYVAYVSAASTTSLTIGVRHVDNTSGSAAVGVSVMALQMTPTSAAG